MQRCLSCGAPNAASTCWHCGHQSSTDGPKPADGVWAPDGTVANAPFIEPPPMATRRLSSRWLLVGVGVAGLFITLSVAIAAGRLSRPGVGSVGVSQATLVPSPDPRPAIVEQTLLPAWVGRRQSVWGPDGTKTVSFALDAISDVTASTSRTPPQLVARCLSRKTEVYIVTGPLSFERQTGSHTVHVQVDDDAAQSEQWVDSEGSHELFAPDAVALTDRLARAQRLRVGFTPFNARPVTAEFIVEGFDQLAPLLTRTCGRRPSPPTR